MPLNNQFSKLVTLYKAYPAEFPQLKPVTLAMWILESGWGESSLAKDHKNYSGMKYRTQIAQYATPVQYQAHDGLDTYCKFSSLDNFILGFWKFLDRSPYDSWRQKADDPKDFIQFIGPIWAQNAQYAAKVIDLIDEATELLDAAAAEPGNFACEACGGDEDIASTEKPRVDRWESTSHFASRNNTDIDHIVIHYTTSRNIEGSISHFKNGNPRTSAHYIIGRDGKLVQMVSDSDTAWHAGNSDMNRRSIGIEHVAALGDAITESQQNTSAKLIRWLMKEYDIPKKNVIPHVCVKATSCCGDLFQKYGGRADGSCDVQKPALHTWMTEMGIA